MSRFNVVNIIMLLTFTASCNSVTQEALPTSTIDSNLLATSSPTGEAEPVLWINPGVAEALGDGLVVTGVSMAETRDMASAWIEPGQDFASDSPKTIWIYALVAPFPTVPDDVSLEEIKQVWSGNGSMVFGSSPILMSGSTQEIFSNLWGVPFGESVKIIESDQLLETAWNSMPSWAIIPFDELEPRWKVLSVDGQSPIQKEFDPASYPLSVSFSLQGSIPDRQQTTIQFPESNRNPDKLTTIILTGVTALVRATAYTMEKKGVIYPGRDIRAIMQQADIAHISNEIPFFSRCGYPPNPGLKKLVFCTYPKYMELLTDIGTDVIELTGNHFGDYGPEAMIETLSMYNEDNIPYYGGGADLADSLKPALFEDHGNKIAFIGCNRPDIGKFPTATDSRPGAAPCDYQYLPKKIRELTDQGYLVISTFQWNERDEYDPVPIPEQLSDFHLMADSGAVIVSGSQAHFPMSMEFYGGAFLHYGLGNLFFDQMGECCAGEYNRWEFMDRYTVYNGRLASVELLTMMLEDYSRPRPMTQPERSRFLNEYFHYSGWTPVYQTPIPQPTVTLTPIQLPPVKIAPTP